MIFIKSQAFIVHIPGGREDAYTLGYREQEEFVQT